MRPRQSHVALNLTPTGKTEPKESIITEDFKNDVELAEQLREIKVDMDISSRVEFSVDFSRIYFRESGWPLKINHEISGHFA